MSAAALRAAGKALVERRSDDARALREAVALAPDDAALWRALGETLMWLGAPEDGLAAIERAVAIAPDEANYDSLLFHMLLAAHVSARAFAERVAEFSHRHGGRLPGLADGFANPPEPDRPLRVGFLSSSLRTNHNSLYFLAPLLYHHDKSRYAISLYGDVAYADAAQQPLTQLVARAVDTHGLDDLALAQAIRRDGIDVLISALGRGSEAPRTRVLRYRAAPLQMCFHHVMTSGYADADYWIADPLTVPAGTPEPFSEKILHIPWNFSFDVFADHGPVAPLPALQRGYVTFASTTHLWKINPAVCAGWRRILDAIPTARLRLKALVFDDASALDTCRQELARHGLPADRVELCPPAPDFWQHMRFYNDVDVVLDTFPYGCGNSALEALWMGVPVLSLQGSRFTGRQALSMLSAIGLGALATRDIDSYVEAARQLASDTAGLQALRRTLRQRLQASPLFDHAGYCRSVEAAIRGAWQSWCRDAAPGRG